MKCTGASCLEGSLFTRLEAEGLTLFLSSSLAQNPRKYKLKLSGLTTLQAPQKVKS